MTLSEDISTISTSLSDIKDAIILKGVTPSGNITTYATAIEEIETINNTSLGVTPSTVSQTLRPSGGYTGYDVVNVQAVTSSIDGNITANNIKNGVSILGVMGTYQSDGVISNLDDNYLIDNNKDISLLTYNGFTLKRNDTEILDNQLFVNAYTNNQYIEKVVLNTLARILSRECFLFTFKNCQNLTSISFKSLQLADGRSLFGEICSGCTNLTNVDFSSLEDIIGLYVLENAFIYCTNLTTLSFPSLRSRYLRESDTLFHTMLYGVTGCTVHFPSNLQSVIGDWSDVVSGFGGTNTTVLFDLSATT